MSYRLAASLARLRDECNERWPDRDKSSDGWIGDYLHATRDSDHNPWVIDSSGVGVVRALDVDAGEGDNREIGLWIAEHVRGLGASGFAALQHGGYVVSAYRIASATSGWRWRTYTGSNPHTTHTHISVSMQQAEYDNPSTWRVAAAPSTPARVLRLATPRMEGDDVREVQRVLAAWYRLPASFVDGVFGDETVRFVKRAQISTPPQPALEADGIVGPLTLAKLGLGG
jgi:hypothetical protein